MLFRAELKKAGLSDKEIAVYVTALTLGPSTVQVIARRAQVARGTTYVTIEKLLEQGLMTQYVEGKRKFFVAEPPQQILRLMEKNSKKYNKPPRTSQCFYQNFSPWLKKVVSTQ